MVGYILFYLFVGVLLVECDAKSDVLYKKYVKSSVKVYFMQVVIWLPEIIDYLINDDYEN